jgi:hypothetical protein
VPSRTLGSHGPTGASPAGASVGRWRQAHRFAMLAAMMMVLAGCGGGINGQTVGDGDLHFFVHGGGLLPRGGQDAEVGGTLTTGDGCVMLDQDGNRFPVVWPRGTSVEATDPLVIELPSGEQLREGDQVSGGGGYPYADALDIEVPEACLNEWGELAVFNPDDDPEVVAREVS